MNEELGTCDAPLFDLDWPHARTDQCTNWKSLPATSLPATAPQNKPTGPIDHLTTYEWWRDQYMTLLEVSNEKVAELEAKIASLRWLTDFCPDCGEKL